LESIKLEYCSLALRDAESCPFSQHWAFRSQQRRYAYFPQDEQAIGHHPNQNNSQGEEHGYKIKDAGLKDKWRLFHRSHAQYRRFARNMCMYTYIYIYV